MTIVFQIAAVLIIAVAGTLFIRGGGARHQALRRILMAIFLLAAASSIFFPQAWTWVANLFGIGRGADLLLYLLVLAFFAFMASTHRKFRQFEKSMTELARQLAIATAPDPSSDSNSTDPDQENSR